MLLTEKNSGYQRGTEQWLGFLKCWQATGEAELIRFEGNTVNEKIKPSAGVSLPNSVKDFYQAYALLSGQFVEPQSDEVGLFQPENIVTLVEYSADLQTALQAWPATSDDEAYYTYGVEQDTATSRTSNYAGALVLGRFGQFPEEIILLYPNSLTADGEYETAILSHAYEFRTPSFAEMMRQLSILETEKKDLMPPYSYQESLNYCSALLALRDVWWK
ncbi:hypothetical protein ORJ00_01340 [Rheinheimera baltica]|uniref:hypothetical protein n=1 Tax=Rheinheimera baltica TaxID=67576 RepID=UPI00273FAFA4|nr:hypothetical protein [Rheinheimera baltica]MDP5141382.1 hypothetical protein [Rheinheimera baltica]